MSDYLMPEYYGAAGDGSTDDAAAFTDLLDAADSTGLPILFKPDAVYALGSTSWTGLSLTLSRDLHIDMNGAALKLLVAPTQTPAAGTVHPIFIFDGTESGRYRLVIRDGVVDFNDLSEPCFAPFQCDIDIQGCKFLNGGDVVGGVGNASIGIYALACSGLVQGNYCRNVGFLVYGGHTDAEMHCDGLRIIANRGEAFHRAVTPTDRGDLFNGVIKNSVIAYNVASGMFGAIGLSGLSSTGTFCENVEIIGNTLSDCLAQGIQTDVYGEGLKLRNIAISNNVIRNTGPAGAAIYAVRIEKFTLSGNIIEGSEYGIVLDDATDGVVTGNQVDGTGATTKRAGVAVNQGLGVCSRIAIGSNYVANYTGANACGFNIPGTAASITVSGGSYDNNTTGVRVVNGSDLVFSGVAAHGNTTDFDVHALDCLLENLSYDTETGIQFFDLSGETPTIGRRRVYRLNNGSPTSVTRFDDGADDVGGANGQEIVLYAANGNTTIDHSESINNVGAVNHSLAANNMIAYRRFGGIWFEQWRNF